MTYRGSVALSLNFLNVSLLEFDAVQFTVYFLSDIGHVNSYYVLAYIDLFLHLDSQVLVFNWVWATFDFFLIMFFRLALVNLERKLFFWVVLLYLACYYLL